MQEKLLKCTEIISRFCDGLAAMHIVWLLFSIKYLIDKKIFDLAILTFDV